MTSIAFTPIDASGGGIVFPHSEGFYNIPIPDIAVIEGHAEYPAVLPPAAVGKVATIALPPGAVITLPDAQGLNFGGLVTTIGGPTGIHARTAAGGGAFFLEHDGNNSGVTNDQLAGCKLRFNLVKLLS